MFERPLCLLCQSEIEPVLTWKTFFWREEPSVCCAPCLAKFEQLDGEGCPRCFKPAESGEVCMDCLKWERDPVLSGCLTRNQSLFRYNEFMKECIAAFKYRGDYALAYAFAPYMKEALEGKDADLIVPIPLSPERIAERGFNQAAALAACAGFSFCEALSRAHTEKQSKKSRRERLRVKPEFDCQVDVRGKHILLLDDIYTTGSTLHHAAYILTQAGAGRIESLTLAR